MERGSALVRCHLLETPVAPSTRNPAVPPTLNDLVIHLLAKEPRARPTAAEAMVTLMKVQAFPGRNGGLTSGIQLYRRFMVGEFAAFR